jgi:hypothetical protein
MYLVNRCCEIECATNIIRFRSVFLPPTVIVVYIYKYYTLVLIDLSAVIKYISFYVYIDKMLAILCSIAEYMPYLLCVGKDKGEN